MRDNVRAGDISLRQSSAADDARRARRIVYLTNCIICHNPDPNLPGSQGPPIAGSSRELVYDRVMLLKYPPGYTPKQNTHTMRALPQLVNRIDDLTAFLADAAKQD
jgi:mono/diheme cytochrome c family protein